jgi:hypothetical protein
MNAIANDVMKQRLSMDWASARVREVVDIAETAPTHLFANVGVFTHLWHSTSVHVQSPEVLLLRELYFPDTAL